MTVVEVVSLGMFLAYFFGLAWIVSRSRCAYDRPEQPLWQYERREAPSKESNL